LEYLQHYADIAEMDIFLLFWILMAIFTRKDHIIKKPF